MARVSPFLLMLPLAAGLAAIPSQAHADYRGYGYGQRYYGGGPRYYGGSPRYYGGYRGGYAGPAIVGGAILGLGLGAALTAPRYYAPPPVYYAPPPVYYAPPPVYYAPPPYYPYR